MSQLTSRVEPSGRIMIPAALRRQVGIGPGDELIVDEKDGIIRMYTWATAIREVQRYFAQYADGTNWSEELMAGRREEVGTDGK